MNIESNKILDHLDIPALQNSPNKEKHFLGLLAEQMERKGLNNSEVKQLLSEFIGLVRQDGIEQAYTTMRNFINQNN